MEAGVAKTPVPIILFVGESRRERDSTHASDHTIPTYLFVMSMTADSVPIRLFDSGRLSNDSPASPVVEGRTTFERASLRIASSVLLTTSFIIIHHPVPQLPRSGTRLKRRSFTGFQARGRIHVSALRVLLRVAWVCHCWWKVGLKTEACLNEPRNKSMMRLRDIAWFFFCGRGTRSASANRGKAWPQPARTKYGDILCRIRGDRDVCSC